MGQLVEEFKQSGLTRRAFCAQHGLTLSNLNNYIRRRGRSGSVSQGGIIPVEIVDRTSALGSRGALWVELGNGRRIEVGSGFEAATLERLVSALERV